MIVTENLTKRYGDVVVVDGLDVLSSAQPSRFSFDRRIDSKIDGC
ncbi:hypothetical protein [Natrialba sp. INN-245]|nr:hypothetical protein [Natrialba sp. INN-245]